MKRITLALVVAISSISTAAVLTSSGSAQTAGTTSLKLTSTDVRSVGYFPRGKPKQGAGFGFGSKVKGDDTGYDRGVCTIIGVKQAVCTVVERLSKGTITATGIVALEGKNNNVPFAITGGTGAYDGARGTALVTDTSTKTSNSTRIDITLLP